jgi:hypothetical protein
MSRGKMLSGFLVVIAVLGVLLVSSQSVGAATSQQNSERLNQIPDADHLLEEQPPGDIQPQTTPQPPEIGGPPHNMVSGILTALFVMIISLGFAILLGGGLVGIILFLVWIIRGRR